MWDVATGAEMRRFEGHSADVNAVAFSPDGRSILTGSDDKTVVLWNAVTGAEQRRFLGHTGAVTALAFNPKGRFAISGSADKTARVWDLEANKEVRRFTGSSWTVHGIVFSPRGDRVFLYSTGRDFDDTDNGYAALWDPDTETELRRFSIENEAVSSVAFAPDGRSVLVATLGTKPGMKHPIARLWDVGSWAEIRQFSGSNSLDGANFVAFSPDGQSVWFGGAKLLSHGPGLFNGHAVEVLDLRTGATAVVYQRRDSGFRVRGLSPNGHDLLMDGTALFPDVFIWDTVKQRNLTRFESTKWAGVSSLGASPDGKFLITAKGTNLDILNGISLGPTDVRDDANGNALWRWDLVAGKPDRLRGHTKVVAAITASPDRRTVASGGWDGALRLWEFDRSSERYVYQAGADVRSIAYSADGKRMVSADQSGFIRIFDTRNILAIPEPLRFVASQRPISAIAISPDGRSVVVGDVTGTVSLWNEDSGGAVRTLGTVAGGINSLAWSPNGDFVVSGGKDKQLRIWELGRNDNSRIFEGHTAPITSVAFSADGQLLLSGAEDRTARLWEIPSGRQVARFAGHSDAVTSVAFVGTGLAATASKDGTTRLWDTKSYRQLATIASFADGGWAVVTPQGHFDASDVDNLAGIHWVQGNEVIFPSDINIRRFYTPGLLSTVTCPYRQTQGCRTLPNVGDLRKVLSRPEVTVIPPARGSTLAKVVIRNNGGGIGDLWLRVNGRELALSTRSRRPDRNAKTAEVMVDLGGARLEPNGDNVVEISAYNAENSARYPGKKVVWQTKTMDDKPRQLWAVVAGTSQYADRSLTLKYPDIDAENFSLALRLGAERLLGDPGRVHIQTLTSRGKRTPNKSNIRDDIARVAAQAAPEDTMVLYLAGHGVAWKDNYYYLTLDARGSDVGSDEALRTNATVSSDELAEWLRQPGIPKKVVVILDTCAAGAATGKLMSISDRRELSYDHKKALQRLREVDTGYHFLMGSAADRVSYEATRYGQGLLTYALLWGMQGAAQGADGTLDIHALFEMAEKEVPRLAQGIGGIQKPEIRSPKGGSFPIGRFSKEDSARIPLAHEKAVLIQAQCFTAALGDPLGLRRRVSEVLRTVSEPLTRGAGGDEPKLVYLNQVTEEFAGSYSPRIRYRVEGGNVTLDIWLMQNESVVAERKLELSVEDPKLPERIVKELITATASLPVR